MSDDSKPNSQLIQEEAERRFAESRKHIIMAESKRDNLRALAAQMQHSFGNILGALAMICKMQEIPDTATVRGLVYRALELLGDNKREYASSEAADWYIRERRIEALLLEIVSRAGTGA